MTKESITAVVDDREPDSVVVTVSAHPDVEDIHIEHLEDGDLLMGNVGIERKTPSDFARSITDDQVNIYEQAESLGMNVRYPFVLLEGRVRGFENLGFSGLPAVAMRGAMASITIRTGVPVIPCDDLEMLVDLGVRLGRKSVEAPGPEFFTRSGRVVDANVTARMLAEIPSVGPQRAMNIADVYPSVTAVSRAAKDDLMAVEGVGENTAETILNALRDGEE